MANVNKATKRKGKKTLKRKDDRTLKRGDDKTPKEPAPAPKLLIKTCAGKEFTVEIPAGGYSSDPFRDLDPAFTYRKAADVITNFAARFVGKAALCEGDCGGDVRLECLPTLQLSIKPTGEGAKAQLDTFTFAEDEKPRRKVLALEVSAGGKFKLRTRCRCVPKSKEGD